ncbi:hypothetical protein P1838_01145 [Salmonella enterica subsp. enterica]|uniref:hypothetical protein n=1 Tax=Salmonella enterica TaxID=28901 RepID=UPI0024166C95|nr:hypothetical protein [Salmonella enterica]WFQ04803.1 hypothetical protein P1838_01145 [Salmonella enterica subsp. enterica]
MNQESSFWNGGDTLSKKSFGKVTLRDGERKIWSASRSAIAIELPAKNDISSDDSSIPDLVDWDDGRNAGIQECAEAIRAAGIKVKE